MSFVIDEDKVRELTAATSGGYVVLPLSTLEIKTENYAPFYSMNEISGTDYDPGVVSMETRRQLGAIRRRIEESGHPLKTVGELTAEIDERRSRNL